MDLSDLSEYPNFSSTYSISGCWHDSGKLRYTQSVAGLACRDLQKHLGILEVKSLDLSLSLCVNPHFPLLAHLRGSILWAKPNFFNHYSDYWLDHLLLIWCTWLYDWMELWDHLVSGCLSIILLPNSHWPLRVILIHYSPNKYFISYFSINLNGVTLIPFNYFIYMEFFSLFLSKFFSSYSLGMVMVNFL